MNETRTINLNGLVYHIDYDAYQLLHEYLSDIEQRLPMSDRQEVMTDIEARVAELFQKALFAKNVQVISIAMVEAVKQQIGSPSEFGENKRPKVRPNTAEPSGCGRIVSITLKVLLVMMALPVLGTMLTVVFALIMAFFGVTIGLGSALPLVPELLPITGNLSPWLAVLAMLCILLIVGLPIAMIVHTIVRFMRTRRGPHARFWWITIALWILSLVSMVGLATHVVGNVNNWHGLVQTIDRWEDGDWDEMDVPVERRDLSAFHTIEVQGMVAVNLRQSAIYEVDVHTRALDQLHTHVSDSVLYIQAPTQPYMPFVVDIALPYLKSIRAMGACDISNEDSAPLVGSELMLDLAGAAEVDMYIDVQTLTIDAKGATSLDLSGEAEKAVITLAGAGEMDADALIVQDMHINCAGASVADVMVEGELWAQATGASKITYKGTPNMRHQIAVGGSVIRQD